MDHIIKSIIRFHSSLLVDGVDTRLSEEEDDTAKFFSSLRDKLLKLDADHFIEEFDRLVTYRKRVGQLLEKDFKKTTLLILTLYLYGSLLESLEISQEDSLKHADATVFRDLIYTILVVGLKKRKNFDDQLLSIQEGSDPAISNNFIWLDPMYKKLKHAFAHGHNEFPYQLKWVKNFELVYGRRPSYVSFESSGTQADHYELMTRTVAHQVSEGNTAFAALSFFVKDRNVSKKSKEYMKRVYIPLSIGDHPLAPGTLADFNTKLAERRAKAAAVIDSTGISVTKKSRILQKGTGEKCCSTGKRTDADFNHTEQAIYAYLEDKINLGKIVEQLVLQLSGLYPAYDDGYYAVDKPLECMTVRSVVLHIHSFFYMCQNCQVGAIGFLSLFRKVLLSALGETPINSSPKLNLPVLVSTHFPYPGKSERHRFLEEDHAKGEIDIKRMSVDGYSLFSQDITWSLRDKSPFLSRKSVVKSMVAKTDENKSLKRVNNELCLEIEKLKKKLKQDTDVGNKDAAPMAGAGSGARM